MTLKQTARFGLLYPIQMSHRHGSLILPSRMVKSLRPSAVTWM